MKDGKQDDMIMSDKKIAKLAKKLAKTFSISENEATKVIHEEWELVKSLFQAHQKVKAVHHHFIDAVHYTYRIA